MSKQTNTAILSVLTIAVLLAAVTIAIPSASLAYASNDNGKQKSQDDKSKTNDKSKKKCHNIKVLVKVTGVTNETDSIDATISLAGKTLSKTVTVDDDDNEVSDGQTASITVPFHFKKLSPCPAVGDEITGTINGQTFTSTLKSIKKPTKVTVPLEQA